MKEMKSKRVQAQRKFAQGAIIPNATSAPTPVVERRSEVLPVKLIHNKLNATSLLDLVAFQNKHLHKIAVVVLQRLGNEKIKTECTPAAAPSASTPAAASIASTLAAACSTSTPAMNYTATTPTTAYSESTAAVTPKALKSSASPKVGSVAARQRVVTDRAQNGMAPMVNIPNRHSMRLRTKSPPKPQRVLDKLPTDLRPSSLATIKRRQTRKIPLPKVQADSDIEDDKPLKYFITGKGSILKPKVKGANGGKGELSGLSYPGSRANTPRPGISTPRPGTSMPHPGTSTPRPGTSTSRPGTSTSRPGTSKTRPGTSTPRPGTSTPQPASKARSYGTRVPTRARRIKKKLPIKRNIKKLNPSSLNITRRQTSTLLKPRGPKSIQGNASKPLRVSRTKPFLPPESNTDLIAEPESAEMTTEVGVPSIVLQTEVIVEKQEYNEAAGHVQGAGQVRGAEQVQGAGHISLAELVQGAEHVHGAELVPGEGHVHGVEHGQEAGHVILAGHVHGAELIQGAGHVIGAGHAQEAGRVHEAELVEGAGQAVGTVQAHGAGDVQDNDEEEFEDDIIQLNYPLIKNEFISDLHMGRYERSDNDMMIEEDAVLIEGTDMTVNGGEQTEAVLCPPCPMARYTTFKEVIEASDSELNWCRHNCKSCNRVNKARQLQNMVDVDVYEFKAELESPRESPRLFRPRQARRVYETPSPMVPINSYDYPAMPRIISTTSIVPAEEVTNDLDNSAATLTSRSDPIATTSTVYQEASVSTSTAFPEFLRSTSTAYPEAVLSTSTANPETVPPTSTTYPETVPSTSSATSTATATDDRPVYLDCLPNNSSFIVQLTDLKRPMIRSRLVRKSQCDITNELSLIEHENILDKMLKNCSRARTKTNPPKKKKYTIVINNTSDEDSEDEPPPNVRYNRRRTAAPTTTSAHDTVSEPARGTAPAPPQETVPVPEQDTTSVAGRAVAEEIAPATEQEIVAPPTREPTPAPAQATVPVAESSAAPATAAAPERTSTPAGSSAPERTSTPAGPSAPERTSTPAGPSAPVIAPSPIPSSGYNTRARPARRTARTTSENSDLLENGILSLRNACDLIEAPVFHPTMEEFQDPVAYFDKIAPNFAKFGLCKVVPPEGFAPPCHLPDDIRFSVHNQYISRMYSRWGPGAREMCAIKARASSQSIVFIRSPLFEGLEVNLPKLFHLVQKNGGLKRVMETRRWGRVAEEMQFSRVTNAAKRVDQLYVKYVVPYDLLSTKERNDIMATVERRWTKKNQKMLERAMKPLHHVKQLMYESESSAEDSDEPNDFYAMAIRETEDCVTNGRLLSLFSFKKIAANAMATYFPRRHDNQPTVNKATNNTAKPATNTPTTSSAPTTSTPVNNTPTTKKPTIKKPIIKKPNVPPPTTGEIEREYWRLMWMAIDHVCINVASIDTGREGYGFPRRKDEPYAHHPWNLKMVSKNPRNVLGSLGLVLGVTVPTLHLGMVFSTSCWHRDPHGLPWIEYLHTGPSKIWYGIPDEQSDVFRTAVETLCPTSCQRKTIWLPSDITMIPPNLLCEHNVRLTRVVQKPGEFIIVHPKAYSSSICTGYTVSESVYFASDSWLDDVAHVFHEVRESCEPTMFSLEQLLISLLQDPRRPPHVLRKVLPLLQELVSEELTLRWSISSQLAVVSEDELPSTSQQKRGRPRRASKVYNAWNVRDLAECDACRTTLYMTKVVDLNQKNSNLCLMHASRLLPKLPRPLPPTAAIVTIYSTAELQEILANAEERLAQTKLL